ncbi:prostatic spermine-binding protein-like [Sycon ciliatum]|uniref:prostatic spermine-binding protein-like n=1 Tax=Sycon ciliatum TaxID=27933 RepID=UPI0031F6DB11
MAVDVDDDEEEEDKEDADADDDDSDGDDSDSVNFFLEQVTGPADTSGGFLGGRPRFLPLEVDTTEHGNEEINNDETEDTNDYDGIEGRGGKDEGNDEHADDDEEDNGNQVGSVPSEEAIPVSVPYLGGRPRLGLDDLASKGIP